MRLFSVAALLASLVMSGCRTLTAAGPGVKGPTRSDTEMDECRDFACNDADGPGPCHPSTCPKLKGRPDAVAETSTDAAKDADGVTLDGKCFEWTVEDDGSLGLIPCRKKTEAEKLQEIRDEIHARTGLQRF